MGEETGFLTSNIPGFFELLLSKGMQNLEGELSAADVDAETCCPEYGFGVGFF